MRDSTACGNIGVQPAIENLSIIKTLLHPECLHETLAEGRFGQLGDSAAPLKVQ